MPEKVANWEAPKQEFPVHTGFRFLELRAMKSWGKTPDEWALIPKECKAECIAFVLVDNAISNYQMQESKKKEKK